jgi:hypothetical protein
MSAHEEGSGRPSLAWALALSVVLHGALVGALFAARPAAPRALPRSYRVDLVAAPAPVAPAPAPAAAPAPAPTPPPAPPKAMPAPPKATLKTPPPKPAPVAAPAGAQPAPANPPSPARGNDVANVHTEGVEFPYPTYLENIVRVIAQRFKPPRNSADKAEVSFVIRRDGSLVPNSLQFVTRSGNFAFDLEAQGAVEQAGDVKAFGPLPPGFSDDVLAVVFSFDPRILH